MTANSLRYRNAQDLSRRFHLQKGTIRRILDISESTQSRYEKNNPILKPAIADRLARFQRLSQQALDLFENEAETLCYHRFCRGAMLAPETLQIFIYGVYYTDLVSVVLE